MGELPPYYEILGVSESASIDEIKRAYKAYARLHHPDMCPGDPDAATRFRVGHEAYEILSDPEARACYDQVRAAVLAGDNVADAAAKFDTEFVDPIRDEPTPNLRDIIDIDLAVQSIQVGAQTAGKAVQANSCSAGCWWLIVGLTSASFPPLWPFLAVIAIIWLVSAFSHYSTEQERR
ncbi:MAG: DnaJ domain-containing protein [Polyangiaceae bacterium]